MTSTSCQKKVLKDSELLHVLESELSSLIYSENNDTDPENNDENPEVADDDSETGVGRPIHTTVGNWSNDIRFEDLQKHEK
ncbi:hypothetical protein K0M31_001868 [Melipona bicolor]|uniref:Uncharacterized protein n=1 Tax=Melipona bicolor TaxID=60889 RepID=A0AA40GGF2_9HYME|nr:hypothetical protein K0M31_001868 [Melipona bicolor]